jgi:hypothetical protein
MAGFLALWERLGEGINSVPNAGVEEELPSQCHRESAAGGRSRRASPWGGDLGWLFQIKGLDRRVRLSSKPSSASIIYSIHLYNLLFLSLLFLLIKFKVDL